MKKSLLLILTFILAFHAQAQVTLSQVDDFQDGTEENWFENAASAGLGLEATNVSTGGPNGAGDAYLRDLASGAGGAGSRMVIRNLDQWTGDFSTAQVFGISMSVRSLTNDITVRVSITGPGGKFSSTTGISVPAGGAWTEIGIPITSSDFTSVSDGVGGGSPGTDINATLSNVTEFRILSSPVPSWRGEVIDAEMHLDDITATGILSVDDFERNANEFSISPNPAKTSLNLRVSNIGSDSSISVYDVMGKQIYQGVLTQLQSSIDISNWRSGVYLVKVSNDESTITKRFIKQ